MARSNAIIGTARARRNFRSRGALLAMLAALACGGCSRTYFSAINVGTGEPLPDRSGIVFDAAHDLRLDVYSPHDARVGDDRALVVFLYGGRWRTGQRTLYRFVGEALARRGIVAVLPDYRVYPRAQFPEFADDVARAVAWARGHARELGADPQRVFVSGHSAGAHLAALVATDPRYLGRVGLRPRDLAGVIGIAGPYDFLPISSPKLREVFASDAQQADSQPVAFVDGDEPPFLLLHGADDRAVHFENSLSLARRLGGHGVPVETYLYTHTGHVRILSALRFRRLAPTLEDVERFVREHRAPEDESLAGSPR
jgi:acetyl esterase/lipase